MHQVTLYTKPECHLCEAVEQVIKRVGTSNPFELTIKNILHDPKDFELYKHDIPVVLLNGTEIARYRLSESEFLTKLGENC